MYVPGTTTPVLVVHVLVTCVALFGRAQMASFKGHSVIEAIRAQSAFLPVLVLYSEYSVGFPLFCNIFIFGNGKLYPLFRYHDQ